jgi:hypothetical protein
MAIKNSLRKIVGTGLTLTTLAMAGCSNGTLRMRTGECPGEYVEQIRPLFGPHYNSLISQIGDTTLFLVDYTNRTIDWNEIGADSNLNKDNIDQLIIKTSGLLEKITPADSNSNTISGRRARNWLKRGNALYLRARECFVDWARREYSKTHPNSSIN